ncbi:hypothetical protein Fcan01_10895 [Folsomia candida]|uniref:Uncharacterized protein n=1 Tax=Folsomia candida TaxID=158441 RepID=A0A226EAZ6_FOLCA|nr:hypothetical protein Fcan01_10895 [Folsomia candida]
MQKFLIFAMLLPNSVPYLRELAYELGRRSDQITSLSCTMHSHQIGAHPGGLNQIGGIHRRLAWLNVSWFVYTRWPENNWPDGPDLWKRSNLHQKHQSWCNIIFYFETQFQATLESEFWDTFSNQIWRLETVFIIIRGYLDYRVHPELEAAPCTVLLEIYSIQPKAYYFLRRDETGAKMVKIWEDYSVITFLSDFPRLGMLTQFLSGRLPIWFNDPDIGTSIWEDSLSHNIVSNNVPTECSKFYDPISRFTCLASEFTYNTFKLQNGIL